METGNRKRVFSGVQPTGKLHLGNYIGAIKQWAAMQHTHDCLFCAVDLHTLTVPEQQPVKQRYAKVREVVGLYLACGIDPEQSTVFVQSHVPQHAELTWILNCATPVGWLERMTQYKAKSVTAKSIGTGLLDYPVLMAADILLYDTDLVPVGGDQKQHVELACDIARRFNNLFGQTLRVPRVVIRPAGARIMGLDDPTAKMSKSTSQDKTGHAIGLLDDEKTMRKAIMSAVTDSGTHVRFDQPSAGVKNLLTIYQALTGVEQEEMHRRFEGKGYGELKRGVFEAVMETVKPIKQRYRELTADRAVLDDVLHRGAQAARDLAHRKMQVVRERVGIG